MVTTNGNLASLVDDSAGAGLGAVIDKALG
jgi:hypothetical protein